MENITFYKKINLFWKVKGQQINLRTLAKTCIRRSDVCVQRHGFAHTTRVSKTYEIQVFCINVEVWNESHIVWEAKPLFSHYIKPYMAHFQNI